MSTIKYIYKCSDHPELIQVIKETFKAISRSKWKACLPKKMEVRFVPEGSAGAVKILSRHPQFFFCNKMIIDGFTKRKNVYETIAKAPIHTIEQLARVVVAHEFGHWVTVLKLSKLRRYGNNPAAASFLLRDKYFNFAVENKINHYSESEQSDRYRNIFEERWADKFARIILRDLEEAPDGNKLNPDKMLRTGKDS